MKIIYQNIANFGIRSSSNLFQFFVEYKQGENPYGVYLPEKENYFTNYNILTWLKELVSGKNYLPDFLYFFRKPLGISNEINEATCLMVIRAMFFYKETQTKSIGNDNLEKSWLDFKSEYDFTYPRSHEEFVNFYNQDNYKNYKAFLNNFEHYISMFNADCDIKEIIAEILVLELFMKNIGRQHFASFQIMRGDSLSHFMDFSLSDEEYPLSSDYLTNTSYFEYSNPQFGSYQIILNWPWCISNEINSDFEKNFTDQEQISVPLKDLLRYSNNYINYKLKTSDHFFKNYTNFLEWVLPVIPNNYEYKIQPSALVDSFITENNITIDQRCQLSPHYEFLAGNAKLSNSYKDYCLSLFKDTVNNSVNIYESPSLIKMPFWELSRIQLVMLKIGILEEEAQEYEYMSRLACEDDLPQEEEEYDQFDNDEMTTEEINEFKQHYRDIMELGMLINPEDKTTEDGFEDGFYNR